MEKKTLIQNVNVVDLRVPTSDTLLGSDPFHKKPNYSAVLVALETNTGLNGISVYDIGVAAGEQVPSPVIFKQLLTSGAIRYCQIDATRLVRVNDVLAVILIAAKYGIPVCPHGGGIGLCNMVRHYALWDSICISDYSTGQVVEYLNFLQDGVFIEPVKVEYGAYVAPTKPGWGLEMHADFVAQP